MSWNYRVFRTKSKNPVTGEEEQFLDIRETYYNEKGTVVNAYSASPDSVAGETIEDIAWQLEAMHKALERPIIEIENEDSGSIG